MVTCSECGAPTVSDPCEGCKTPMEWSAALNMIYQPPYTEFGVSYGPRTAGAAHREMQEFATERYGAVGSPAQWDASEEPAAVARDAQRQAPRKDAALFDLRIESLQGATPKRELACAMLFWRSRMSVGRIATHLGVKQPTVREWIRRMRERMRG